MFVRSAVLATALAVCFMASMSATSPTLAGESITVTKTEDTADGTCNADCSLREAVIAANANPDANTINVPAGLYFLTIPGDHEDAAAQDDLDLTEDVTIVGLNAARTGVSGFEGAMIDGGDTTRIFDIIPADIVVSMSNVVLLNGMSPTVGGAIDNHAELSLSNVTIVNNEAPEGGGISNQGTLALSHSVVSSNIATDGNGGGIRNEATGTVNILESTIANNLAQGGDEPEGGGITNEGTVEIVDSTVEHNTSGDSGGGINNEVGAMLTVENSTIVDNISGSSSGAIFNGGHTTITRTTVSNNTSENEGGAMRSNGTLTVDSSTFSGNTAGTRAGGVLAIDLQVENSTFSGNVAMGGDGGGIQIDGVLALLNVTITGNSASSGGDGLAFEGVAAISNTIIAGNAGVDCQLDNSFTSLGHNLDSDGTCGFNGTGDQPNTDPKLGPLADNGGLTQTHALLGGSPAIDAGDSAVCPDFDQRGVDRDVACDIGAYEAEFFGDERVWGDNNCSGGADPVDGLLALRFDGGLPTDTGECPAMGDVVEVGSASPHPWGDVDCSGEVNPVDSLKLLRFDAGLEVVQPDGCPEVGAEVSVS